MNGETAPDSGPVGQGSRLRSGPSPLAAATAYQHEVDGAEYLFAGLGFADMAHLLELTDLDLVPASAASHLAAGLIEVQQGGAEAIDWDPQFGDIYNNRMRRLQEVVGSDTDHLHVGRARREATTIAWQLACRDGLADLADATIELARTVLRRAEDERSTLAADYTYLQRAQPTNLGHYLIGFAMPLMRDLERLAGAYVRLDRSPAGSGSVNGSAIPLDRTRIGERLGFAAPLAHTRDAMWQSDLAIEIATAAAIPMTTVGRLAEDLFVWSTIEFGLFECADEHARNSVIMPQKKNPYCLAYLRGQARTAFATVSAVQATQLSATGQPDNRTTAYAELPPVVHGTAQDLRLLAEVLDRGSFAHDRLQAAARADHAYATDYCDLLTLHHGVPNRTAHRYLGRAIRSAIDAGRDFVADEDLDIAAEELGLDLPRLSDAELAIARDPAELVESRATLGGASQTSLDVVFAETQGTLDAAAAEWRTRTQHNQERAARLLDEMARIANGD